MPLAQEVVRRRSEQATSIDSFAPRFPPDLDDSFLLRQDTEVPRAAESRDEVDFLPHLLQRFARLAVRIEAAVNPRGQWETPFGTKPALANPTTFACAMNGFFGTRDTKLTTKPQRL